MKDDYRFDYIEATGVSQVKSSRGTLHAIVVGTTSAGAITVIDGVDGTSENKLAELKASIAEGTYEFDCTFANGLYIGNPGGSKITVIYR